MACVIATWCCCPIQRDLCLPHIVRGDRPYLKISAMIRECTVVLSLNFSMERVLFSISISLFHFCPMKFFPLGPDGRNSLNGVYEQLKLYSLRAVDAVCYPSFYSVIDAFAVR